MYWRVHVYALESIRIKCTFELSHSHIRIICHKMNKFVDGCFELSFCACSDHTDGAEA